MFSRTRQFWGEKSQPLKGLVAVSLRSDIPPTWPVPLPQHENKHTLVLDIDETLIHTVAAEHHIPREDEGKDVAATPLVDYRMLLRPHLKEFLEEVNQLFEVVFWTAGVASYCSGVVDALETQVMSLPNSFYNYREIVKDIHTKDGTNHTNFYALSRTQTLEDKQYMKYIPMLGRPLKSVIMLDDNVRSFPLTPRNGIYIPPFLPDERVLAGYFTAVSKAKEAGDMTKLSQNELMFLYAGQQEFKRLENDTALLDVMPMLRAVAKVPSGGDVTRELDHWRSMEYVQCDNFEENMNLRSTVRTELLGKTLTERNEQPIPPLTTHHKNVMLVEVMKTSVELNKVKFKRTTSNL